MVDLMIGKTNVTKLLRGKAAAAAAAAADKTKILLLQVPAEKQMEVNTESLKILINENNYSCVYVTLSKPYTELEKLFKSGGVDVTNLFFVDAISQMYGVKQATTKKCSYVSGPLDIDSIAIALKELLSSLTTKKKCVFLDTITTVLLYNSLPRTIRFSQFLTQTLKKIGVEGVLVSVAKGATTEKLVKELAKLCDEVITIE